MSPLFLLPLVTLTAAPPVLPEPAHVKRLAVVVGANRAAPGREPLRYAHQDAREIASVLVEAGQFSAQDVVVLEDPEPARILETLDSRLEQLGRAGEQGMLLFYYSGHSDERALYPNGQPLELKALRTRLEDGRAAVRVGILDACQGGSWTRAKGLTPAAPFAVEVPLTLSSEGSVLLASSTGQEASHEADTLRGSFFTHHLVAGLRGAADQSGDGQVTVGEAFAYAQRLTIRDTAMLGEAVQHPSFDLRLRGRQDLPLTRLASAGSTLEVQQETGPLQVIQLHTGLVVLEVPEGRRALRLALPVGPYLVRHRTREGTFAREVEVRAGQTVTVREENLELVGAPVLSTKRFTRPLAATLTTLPGGTSALGVKVTTGYQEMVGVSFVRAGPPAFYALEFFALRGSYRLGLTDRLQLEVLNLPSALFVGSRTVFQVPSPSLAFRMGEAGRSEWTPFVSANAYVPSLEEGLMNVSLNTGLRTRQWLSPSSSLHLGASLQHGFWLKSESETDLRMPLVTNIAASIGYSVTVGEVVTLAVGVSGWVGIPHPPGRDEIDLTEEPRLDWVGLRIGSSDFQQTGSRLPFISIHLDEAWSLTGDVGVGFSKNGVWTDYGVGVLATF